MQQEQSQHAQWVWRKGGHCATHCCPVTLLCHRVLYYLLDSVLLENGKSFTRYSVTLNPENKLLRGKICTRDTKVKQETERFAKTGKDVLLKHNCRQKCS